MKKRSAATILVSSLVGLLAGAGQVFYISFFPACVLGTVLAGGLLVLVFLLDNRPKSPEDVMRYANIPTLAVIPANPELSGTKKRGRKAGRL